MSLSLGTVLWLCLQPGLAMEDGPASPPPPVPRYTNEDLERVAPLRDQTGRWSAPPPAKAAPAADTRAGGRGEAYWRREAERLRDRIWPLHERARELRLQIEERQKQPGVRPYTDDRVQGWQRRLQALEQRIRDLESRFEERARKDGALPGWLR